MWRDGNEITTDVTNLVPGDLVGLRVGDVVPADVRLVDVTGLECDEAVLTGESLPVEKSADSRPLGESPLDLPGCAFMGTVVHQGAARGIVVSTGTSTAFGKIAVGLGERQADTAFQVGLRGFSALLVKVAGVLTVSIFVINVALSRPLIESLLFSLAIAIGITPQLLPAIVSVSLSTGSRALARKRVLVKRLVTIEDLGNIEVLFTDKTGTLTEGAITFHESLDALGTASSDMLLLGLECNEATMTDTGPVGGNSLDLALLAAPTAAPLLTVTDGVAAHERLGLLPFDHDRQLASVVTRTPDGATTLITKGAPEAVMARCVDIPAASQAVLDGLFGDGARVVAVATRDAPGLVQPAAADERDLRLAGFLSFVDRPKADAGAAIAEAEPPRCRREDHHGRQRHGRSQGLPRHRTRGRRRARAARRSRRSTTTPSPRRSRRRRSSRGSAPIRSRASSRSRAAPESTSRSSATASTTRSRCTPPTSGSPSTRRPMSRRTRPTSCCWTRTSACSPTACMEGRRIFANTLKYVLMATSSNFGNMFSAAGASLFLSYLPMLPSQILLNNLLYDVGQMAIPTDRVDPEVLARPAAWDIAFVRRFMVVFGPVSSVFDFATFFVMLVILNAGHSRVPHRLVRRVDRDADARDLRDPHAPRAVPAQPAEPPDDRAADHLCARSASRSRSRRSPTCSGSRLCRSRSS